jgi:Transcriptional accessory protein
MPKSVESRIAAELGVEEWQVKATAEMIDAGDTIPFIARYRKEATGSLDDSQLRLLGERLQYIRELDARREAIVSAIMEQGRMDDALLVALLEADTKARLEDLYQPFRPKFRSKGQEAIEAGLLPLADSLLADPSLDPQAAAAPYVAADTPYADTKSVLNGARAILSERFADHPDLVGRLREHMWEKGRLKADLAEGVDPGTSKYADYHGFAEPFRKVAPHRISAVFRGEREGQLTVRIDPLEADVADPRAPTPYETMVAAAWGISDRGRPVDAWLAECVRWSWRTRLSVSIESDIRVRLQESAETAAVSAFASNVKALLLAAPAGMLPTLGLDPGYRSGVKVAVVDGTGKVKAHTTVYPHQPDNRWRESLMELSSLCRAHGVKLIAVGNGTASRETDRLAGELVKANPDLAMTKAMVSEDGASVYSASAYAAREFPDLDVTIRGAVSIARRLQDPLAELVKIDPKSMGVGQYQHDVTPTLLARSLDGVVEYCVNSVGVDLNTASVPLLARVAGIGESLAEAIVRHRDENGPFPSRQALLDVPRMGEKTFRQCAGFLRVANGTNPLDASAVHPESYPLVERILAVTGSELASVMGNTRLLRSIKPETLADERFGTPTVTDVLAELEKPGRDPRPVFRSAAFADGVEKPSDLKPGMLLDGTVSSVAAFGAFVDIGVHEDGLVHVSAMSDRFVRDPLEVVKPGDVVKVKVLAVDLARNRISLTMRLSDEPPRADSPATRDRRSDRVPARGREAPANTALADALRRAARR